MDPSQVLQRLHFGRVDAESDYRLSQCFVGTDMLKHALTPQHSLFIGPKGSGKSALFRLLCGDLSPWKSLLPRNYEVIFRIPATGLQSERYLSGVDLDELSPSTANDFRAFWLLYIGLKTATTLVEDQRMQNLVEHSANPRVKEHYTTLARVVRQLGLVEGSTIEKLKQRIDSLMEDQVVSETVTPTEVGRALSVNFRNRTGLAIISLLDVIDNLLQETKCLSWILLDKLDLLFFDDINRLHQSITGLVQLLVEYSDRFRNIHFKIFLRRDIYRQLRIVNKSHLVSYTNEMKWRGPWLIKLLVARAVSDPLVETHCEQALGGEKADVAAVINGSDEFVLRVFYTIFDRSMGIIRREPHVSPTHQWILKRVVDGLGMGFPREMIHLGNTASARQRELNRSAGGGGNGALISARALRLAFDAVSEYRCETYLNAEFPHLRNHFNIFRGKEHPVVLKSELVDQCRTLDPAGEEAVRVLYDVGLLVPLGKNPDAALKFEVPLLYRSGLGIVERKKRKGRPRVIQDKESAPHAAPVRKESVEEANIPMPPQR